MPGRSQIVKNTVRKHQVSPISVEELQNAETVIIKWIQNNAFLKEIDVLQEIQANASCKDRKFAKVKKAVMKKSNGICRLNSFLHPNGTLRVDGRINKADMSEKVRHPIILPRNGHPTTLIIRHFHQKVQHSGKGITLNELRASGYWIVNGNAAVRSVVCKMSPSSWIRRRAKDGESPRVSFGTSATVYILRGRLFRAMVGKGRA